jgi:hypothetical protein
MHVVILETTKSKQHNLSPTYSLQCALGGSEKIFNTTKKNLNFDLKKGLKSLMKDGVSGLNNTDVMIIIAIHCTKDVLILFIIPYAFQFQWG